MANGQSAYAAFWLYQRHDSWRSLDDATFERGKGELEALLTHPEPHITVRGVYSSLGLRPDVDLIVWAHAEHLDLLQRLAIGIDQTTLGGYLVLKQSYIGVGGMSQYDPEHGPAFVKGIPPKRYLSVYPFTKTPDWYLVDYQERRRLMVEHGEMGREFPEILTNTVNSFGIQDQEFVVALEDDAPHQLIRMVQRLRAAEVRKWTALDTPIFLGDRKPTAAVLDDIRGSRAVANVI
jgi:chlorite dismutase